MISTTQRVPDWRGRIHANRFFSSLYDLGKSFIDVLAPARCISCLQEGTWYCILCQQQMQKLPQRCFVCNNHSLSGKVCMPCRDSTALRGVISGGLYASPAIQRGIHWLKDKGIRDIAPILIQPLVPHILNIAPLKVLQRQGCFVPIPLHVRREEQRGFNQSMDIAQALSSFTQIPIYPLLSRVKATAPQTQLPVKMRFENVDQAFVLTRLIPLHIRYILLVDDITFSGSTLSAAATPLLEEKEMWGVTIARG